MGDSSGLLTLVPEELVYQDVRLNQVRMLGKEEC